jgi:hypothetical protein
MPNVRNIGPETGEPVIQVDICPAHYLRNDLPTVDSAANGGSRSTARLWESGNTAGPTLSFQRWAGVAFLAATG